MQMEKVALGPPTHATSRTPSAACVSCMLCHLTTTARDGIAFLDGEKGRLVLCHRTRALVRGVPSRARISQPGHQLPTMSLILVTSDNFEVYLSSEEVDGCASLRSSPARGTRELVPVRCNELQVDAWIQGCDCLKSGEDLLHEQLIPGFQVRGAPNEGTAP